MIKSFFITSIKIVLALVVIFLLSVHIFSEIIYQRFKNEIFTSSDSLVTFVDRENAPNALVFGAGLNSSNLPSPILEDRIVLAVELYKNYKVNKLIMTGDNTSLGHNEPDVMRDEAVRLGVPIEDIVMDYAGRKTYDSCFRAKEIFSQKSLILVTQDFHITRAMFLCESLGIESKGISTSTEKYDFPSQLYWEIRDEFSMIKAVYELNFGKGDVILGDKIKI